MTDGSGFSTLPDDLPPGRLIIGSFTDATWGDRPLLWVTDEPIYDLGELWKRSFQTREETGLYPLLLATMNSDPDRPWHDAELAYMPVEEVDAIDVESCLSRWAEHRPWSGLANPGVQQREPDEAAAAMVEEVTAFRPWLVGLVPASRGADALALSGWTGPTNHSPTAPISAVVRSWEERFGARVVWVGFDELALSVAAPPVSIEHARQVAAEHCAFCPDNIDQSHHDFEGYAASLVGAREWRFWWD